MTDYKKNIESNFKSLKAGLVPKDKDSVPKLPQAQKEWWEKFFLLLYILLDNLMYDSIMCGDTVAKWIVHWTLALNGPDWSPCWVNGVVFLGKTLNCSHRASRSPLSLHNCGVGEQRKTYTPKKAVKKSVNRANDCCRMCKCSFMLSMEPENLVANDVYIKFVHSLKSWWQPWWSFGLDVQEHWCSIY